MNMKIGVIGMGYVGLVTGAGLAHLGHRVICADIACEKIKMLNSGELPIWEKGLKDLVTGARSRIQFTADVPQTVREADILFLAVGTPSSPSGEPDLTQLWSAVGQIARHTERRKLIVVKSTVPVGTCDAVEAYLKEHLLNDLIIDVVHNPEFLRQGNAVQDFLHPDRIVIGYQNEPAREIMGMIYGKLDAPIQYCDRRSAEMIKYASNAFLAMKISYINMIAGLCEKLNADVEEVAKGMGLDPRIGSAFLKAGAGYGGSCFPKDTNALLMMGKKANYTLPLVEATIEINRRQPLRLIDKLRDHLGNLKQKKIALLGLTYKPNTDDIRDASSLILCKCLLQENAIVHAYDPVVRKFPLEQVRLFPDIYSALEGCDAMVILTEWEEFTQLDCETIRSKLNYPLILDGRNLFPLPEMRNIAETLGFTYLSVGRPPVLGSPEKITVSIFA